MARKQPTADQKAASRGAQLLCALCSRPTVRRGLETITTNASEAHADGTTAAEIDAGAVRLQMRLLGNSSNLGPTN